MDFFNVMYIVLNVIYHFQNKVKGFFLLTQLLIHKRTFFCIYDGFMHYQWCFLFSSEPYTIDRMIANATYNSSKTQTISISSPLDNLYRNPSQCCQTLQTDTQFIHMETQTPDEDSFSINQFWNIKWFLKKS
jgi:hypothetical protein